MLIHNEKTRIDSTALAAGLWILLTLALALVIASFGMFFDITVNAVTMPLSLVISGIFIFRHSCSRCFNRSVAIIVVSWILMTILSILLIDYSFDGIAYHQESIFAFFKGDNFFLNPAGYTGNSLWTQHYAKGIEMLAAHMMCLTGDIESGKAINLMLGLATALILWYTLGLITCNRRTETDKRLSKTSRIVITSLVMANPVFMNQMLTYYNDFASYLFIILTLCLSVMLCKGDGKVICCYGLAATVILSIATKFNAAFFEALTIALTLLWLWWKNGIDYRPARLILIVSLVTAAITAVVICYHPYITNLTNCGNPFYPIMGENAEDIMTYNTPEQYLTSDRFSNFVDSHLKFHTESLRINTDNRIGGFGPFSFLLFPLGLIAVAVRAIYLRRFDWTCLLAAAVVLSCFCFGQSWWARYFPQLWLLVPLGYYCCLYFKNRSSAIVRKIVIVFSILTVILCIGSIYFYYVNKQLRRESVITVLHNENRTINAYVSDMCYSDHFGWILGKTGIDCHLYPWPPHDDVITYEFFDNSLLFIEVTPEEYDLIQADYDRRRDRWGRHLWKGAADFARSILK